MSDTIWVFSIGSGTVMMLFSKIFPEPSCLLPPVLAATGLPRVPITHRTGLAVTGLPRVPVAHSTYSSDIHQVRSILNSNSSKAFCPVREIHGFQMPTSLLLPCHLVHTFTIYFLSLSGILNIASKTAVAASLAFAGSAPLGKPRLTLLPLFSSSLEDSVHTSALHHISHHLIPALYLSLETCQNEVIFFGPKIHEHRDYFHCFVHCYFSIIYNPGCDKAMKTSQKYETFYVLTQLLIKMWYYYWKKSCLKVYIQIFFKSCLCLPLFAGIKILWQQINLLKSQVKPITLCFNEQDIFSTDFGGVQDLEMRAMKVRTTTHKLGRQGKACGQLTTRHQRTSSSLCWEESSRPQTEETTIMLNCAITLGYVRLLN